MGRNEARPLLHPRIMLTLGNVLLFLLFGLVVGAIARWIMPGHEPGGWTFSMFLGIAGSFLGGFVAHAIGISSVSRPAGLVVSILGAMVLLGVYHALRNWRHSHA